MPEHRSSKQCWGGGGRVGVGVGSCHSTVALCFLTVEKIVTFNVFLIKKWKSFPACDNVRVCDQTSKLQAGSAFSIACTRLPV